MRYRQHFSLRLSFTSSRRMTVRDASPPNPHFRITLKPPSSPLTSQRHSLNSTASQRHKLWCAHRLLKPSYFALPCALRMIHTTPLLHRRRRPRIEQPPPLWPTSRPCLLPLPLPTVRRRRPNNHLADQTAPPPSPPSPEPPPFPLPPWPTPSTLPLPPLPKPPPWRTITAFGCQNHQPSLHSAANIIIGCQLYQLYRLPFFLRW